MHEQVRTGQLAANCTMDGREVKVHASFRLYLHTPYSSLPPGPLQGLTPVWWAATHTGCCSQLLAAVLHCERPDLEKQHRDTVQSAAADERLIQASITLLVEHSDAVCVCCEPPDMPPHA